MPNQQYKTTKGNPTGTRDINKQKQPVICIQLSMLVTHTPLGRDATAKLVIALVLLRLDHCNAVRVGLPATTLVPLRTVLHAAARTVLDLKLCGSCIGCRSHRDYSTSCACLYTRCSSGTLPITLPACWRPPLTFLHSRHCVRRVSK